MVASNIESVTESASTPRTAAESTRRAGLAYALSAYTLWGFLPIYFLLLLPSSPFEIVAFRILFSLVFCALLLTVTRNWGALLTVMRDRRLLFTMGLAGVFIYINWQVYIFAATTGHVLEGSLGAQALSADATSHVTGGPATPTGTGVPKRRP